MNPVCVPLSSHDATQVKSGRDDENEGNEWGDGDYEKSDVEDDDGGHEESVVGQC